MMMMMMNAEATHDMSSRGKLSPHTGVWASQSVKFPQVAMEDVMESCSWSSQGLKTGVRQETSIKPPLPERCKISVYDTETI